MSDPVNPDQPYTPSDDVLRETIALAVPGLLLDRDYERWDVADAIIEALEPLIASVCRDAQAEQRERDINLIERLESNSPLGGLLLHSDAIAAIRRNENGEQG